MPPEGYETVTLPERLVAELDHHSKSIGASSRAEAIRSLLDGYDSRVSARVTDIESGVYEDMATVLGPKIAEQVVAEIGGQ